MKFDAPHGITIGISAKSIYEHSLALVTLKADQSFGASVSGQLISLERGKHDPDNSEILRAEEKGSSYVIEVEILGLFRERRIATTGEDPAELMYGMRFYPFVSSFVTGKITTHDLPVSLIFVELPDAFRVIHFDSIVRNPEGIESEKSRHSYDADESKYIFLWEGVENSVGTYNLQIPVRFGGTTLMKMANFPLIYYWILSLVVVAVASFSDKTVVLYGAIGAVWTFMMQQYITSNPPQRKTLLAAIYLAEAAFTLVWAMAWLYLSWWALILSIPALLCCLCLSKTMDKFGNTGSLPSRVENTWRSAIRRAVKRQRDSLGL